MNNHSDFSGGGVALFRIFKTSINSQPQPLTSIGKYTPKPAFINNTIVNNTAPDGAGIFTMNHIPFFMNNILWNSSNPEAEWGEIFIGNVDRWIEDNSYGDIEICYSDIQGGWDGEGNIDHNPSFADSNFNLSDTSYCVGNGMDSVEVDGYLYTCPASDYQDKPRPHSVDEFIDMGAIESPYPKVQLQSIIKKKNLMVIHEFKLFQNYPNPFNSETNIVYEVAKPCRVNLRIYDILGQEIRTLIDRSHAAGIHKVHFDASALAAGIYFYKISIDNVFSEMKKLILLK
jgi:hypothetical protein